MDNICLKYLGRKLKLFLSFQCDASNRIFRVKECIVACKKHCRVCFGWFLIFFELFLHLLQDKSNKLILRAEWRSNGSLFFKPYSNHTDLIRKTKESKTSNHLSYILFHCEIEMFNGNINNTLTLLWFSSSIILNSLCSKAEYGRYFY
jgi:hypothetical protein